jgi:hypothetical protein
MGKANSPEDFKNLETLFTQNEEVAKESESKKVEEKSE